MSQQATKITWRNTSTDTPPLEEEVLTIYKGSLISGYYHGKTYFRNYLFGTDQEWSSEIWSEYAEEYPSQPDTLI